MLRPRCGAAESWEGLMLDRASPLCPIALGALGMPGAAAAHDVPVLGPARQNLPGLRRGGDAGDEHRAAAATVFARSLR